MKFIILSFIILGMASRLETSFIGGLFKSGKPVTSTKDKSVSDAFKAYDKNNDGFIDASDAKKFFEDKKSTYLTGWTQQSREEGRSGLVEALTKLGGRMNPEQFQQYMAESGGSNPTITKEDIIAIQGNTVKPVAQLAQLYKVDKERLKRSLNKQSYNDLVTVEEIVTFLNQNPSTADQLKEKHGMNKKN